MMYPPDVFVVAKYTAPSSNNTPLFLKPVLVTSRIQTRSKQEAPDNDAKTPPPTYSELFLHGFGVIQNITQYKDIPASPVIVGQAPTRRDVRKVDRFTRMVADPTFERPSHDHLLDLADANSCVRILEQVHFYQSAAIGLGAPQTCVLSLSLTAPQDVNADAKKTLVGSDAWVCAENGERIKLMNTVTANGKLFNDYKAYLTDLATKNDGFIESDAHSVQTASTMVFFKHHPTAPEASLAHRNLLLMQGNSSLSLN